MSNHIFISYSNTDGLDFARRLADELEGGDDKFVEENRRRKKEAKRKQKEMARK